jgi:hypothetical protein
MKKREGRNLYSSSPCSHRSKPHDEGTSGTSNSHNWGEGGNRPFEHNKVQIVYTKRKEAGPPPSHRQAGSDGISMSYRRTGWETIRLGEASQARLIFGWASGKALVTKRWWFSDDKNLRSYNIYIFLPNTHKHFNQYE